MYVLLSMLGEWIELPVECGLEQDASGRLRQLSVKGEALSAARKLADALTAVGLPVDRLEVVDVEGQSEIRFDLDVTSNRPDCLGHLGVARELSVILDRPFKRPEMPCLAWIEGEQEAGCVRIEDAEGCDQYVGLRIREVEVRPSPDWLRRRLLALGQRPIHNVVDATNLVLFELGQPLHAFDADCLEGGWIHVRRARTGERIVTLDGLERELGEEILVIADGERAVAVAGVMGGQETAVSSSTRNVFLESAHFQPRRIRRAARMLALGTEASYRFERGTDPAICKEAALRCAALLTELGGGRLEVPGYAVQVNPLPRLDWELELEQLERFAGRSFELPTVKRIFAFLGFEPVEKGPGRLVGKVPSFRLPDFVARPGEPGSQPLAEAQDLYEEVLRHVGLDAIPSTLPNLGGADSGWHVGFVRRRKAQDVLRALGLAETISWSFQSEKQDQSFPRLREEGPAVRVANPISDRHTVLRRSLLPHLVEAAVFNLRHGASAVRLFEVGCLFPGKEAEEVEAIAWIAGGRSEVLWDREPELDLFTVKGWGECLLRVLGVRSFLVEPAELPGVVPTTGGWWCLSNGSRIGWFGRLLEVEGTVPLFAGEVLLSELGPAEPPAVKAPPRLPAVVADYTLLHPLSVSWKEIAAVVTSWQRPPCEGFVLLDRYRGPQVPEGWVATTLRCTYRALDRALTQEEVNAVQAELAELLEERFGRRAFAS
jgi:phenylalanyl-tRNA synthetase beta chain